MKHFIVGYGSLINLRSLQRTLPQVQYSLPVRVHGFQRKWNAREDVTVSFSTTYLGINTDDESSFNGVLFEVEESELEIIDAREFLYERIEVKKDSVEILGGDFHEDKAQKVWIYLTKKPKEVIKEFPLIQSYIDVCVSGCLEIEEKFSLQGFAKEFLKSTYSWSTHWVNDRIYPRSPHIHQPRAFEIDKLLFQNLNSYYKEITIE